MAVDSALHIASLNPLIPTGSDQVAEADNNFRQLKSVLVTDFPNIAGPVTATHTELNTVPSRSLRAGDTYSGAHDFTGATITVANATLAGQPYTKAQVDSLVIAATAPSFTPSTTAVSKTLVAFEQCAVTASGQTISLPSAPTAGVTVCRVRTRAGVTTTIGRNGNNIQGLAEDMSVPYGNVTVTLGYQDSTDGWVLL
jgi:hypothetical protein